MANPAIEDRVLAARKEKGQGAGDSQSVAGQEELGIRADVEEAVSEA